jgi:hypothetical protein
MNGYTPKNENGSADCAEYADFFSRSGPGTLRVAPSTDFTDLNPPNPPNPQSIFTAVIMNGYTSNNENQSTDFTDFTDFDPGSSA